MTNFNHEWVAVCGNRYVPVIFYELIKEIARDGLPYMQDKSPFTVKQLCGDGFWACLRNGEKRMAGGCIAKLVKEGQLPLRLAGKKSNSHVFEKVILSRVL